MPQDPSLAFIQNLVDRYTQFKMLQFQIARENRQEERYERQLQEQTRQFGITQRGIEERFKAGQELTREQFGATRKFQEETTGPYYKARAGLAEAQIEKATQFPSAETLNLATGLRKEFIGGPAYKDFLTVQRSEAAMKSAYDMSLRPDVKSKVASDQALAVMFQKMLDPTSVVRESEYARTPEGVGILNRVTAYIPQLQKGGLAISNEDRKALYDMAKVLLENAKVTVNKHIANYKSLAAIYGVPSEYVLGEIKEFPVESSPDPNGGEPTDAKTREPVSSPRQPLFKGETLRFTYPYKMPESKETFLNMVREINAAGETDAAQRYYNQWIDKFNWEEE